MPQPIDRLNAALTGRYRVDRELGRGGMATVYQAQDLKHERPVAIKVLLPELAAVVGTDRFLREIKLTAQLNHPHILPLLDSGEAGGFLYYVMPLMEGESLRDRLRREKQLSVDDAARIAREVADALDYAHGRNVIHRDIKPENILIQGQHAVVADFGIATAVSVAGGDRLTATGVVVGTPEYMSPEQASGRGELDRRSDVYALGCVLYETLAGHPPFMGTTTQEVLARHALDAVPSLEAARPGVPAGMAEAIKRALAKAPVDRFASTSDLAQALSTESSASAGASRASEATQERGPLAGKGRAIGRWVVLPALALGVLAYVVWRNGQTRSTSTMPAVFTVPLPGGTTLAVGNGLALAVSPDGDRYVYVGESASSRQLYLRPIDQMNATPLPGTQGATDPLFSPDGKWIAFVANGQLKRVSLSGGRAETVAQLEGSFQGGSWGPADTIIFAQGAGLFRVPASGGVPVLVLAPRSGESLYTWPSLLPGGAILFGVATGMSYDPMRIEVLRPQTGERRLLLREGLYPRYAPSGHIVYAARSGETQVTAVRAVAVDPEQLQVLGVPLMVLDSVLVRGMVTAQFDFSTGGSLVYVMARAPAAPTSLHWVDRQGRAELIDYLPSRSFGTPVISPDGQRVGLTSAGDTLKVWLADLRRETVSELATGGRTTHLTVWAPGGDRVAFASNREDSLVNIYVKWLTGRSDVERLTVSPQHQDPASWSPDGKHLFYAGFDPTTGWDIWVLDLSSSPPAARMLIGGPARESNPMISPDGRWLAYVSAETGRPEVYVDRFPELGARQQVSRDTGDEPLWSRTGRELFYTTTDPTTGLLSVWAVGVELGQDLVLGAARLLFRGGSNTGRAWGRPRYDVTPDGRRFLIVHRGTPPPPSLDFVVVLNWFDELKRRVRPTR